MLKGTYCGLRAIASSDLKQLLEWRNNPDFRKYFREHRELSHEQQLQWFNHTVQKDPKVKMFAIVDLESDALIGACGLCYIDAQNRNADFSIYIGKNDEYIDNKFAPDVGRVLLKYGFQELNLHRIWAEIYSIDQAKMNLFESLGFRLEGEHKETHWTGGHWVDSLFYGILAKEFNKTLLNGDAR